MTETRKTVTVLFTDLTGYTSLAEGLDPEVVGRIVTRFGQEMRAVAERHGGRVEKFIGDAVMAVFGVPTVHEDDAIRAVRAASEMRAAVERMSDDVTVDPPLTAHAGIETGEVIVSDDPDRLATGDAINIAARLQSAAGPGEILLGEATYRLVHEAIRAEPLPPLELKGKARPVAAYRLLRVDPHGEAFRRRLDAPLVGRQAELLEILGEFDRAERERACTLVTIVGPAGVGKSRLASEVLAKIAGKGRVLAGRCLSYGDGITFWPIAEALRQAAGITDGHTPDEARARLGSLVRGDDAELVRDRAASVIGMGAGTESLQEAFWAVRRILEAISEDGPVALFIEDIHWAEPALLDLLEYLTEFSAERPILILCTARPDLSETRPAWARGAVTVVLEPLTVDESARFIESLLDTPKVPPWVVERVARIAEGNPLFVEQFVRMLIDDGVLVRDDGHWETRTESERLVAPATISALLAARIDGLGQGDRGTLQRGSVIGRVFYWGAVADLSPPPERNGVGSSLQTLLRKQLIRPDHSAFAGEDAFAFSHILVRDAAYDSTPKAVRAELHERFARWLERIAGGRLAEYEEIVGYHLEQAARYHASLGSVDVSTEALAREAGDRLAAAGMRANARGDQQAATNLLERAATLLPSDAPARAATLSTLGITLLEVGRVGDAIAALDEAVAVAQRAGEVRIEQVAKVRRTYVRVHGTVLPDLDAVWAESEEAVRILEGLGDDQALGEGLAVLGAGRFYRGDVAGALRAERRALEYARSAGDERTARWAARWTSNIMTNGDTPVDEAIAHVEGFLTEAPRESYFEASLLRSLAALLLKAARYEEARDTGRRAQDRATQLGLRVEIGGGLRGLGDLEMTLGRMDEAERALREAVELFGRMGDPAHGTSVASQLAGTLARQGRLEEARAALRLAREWLSPDDVDGVFECERAETDIALAARDVGTALEHARSTLEAVEGTGYLSNRIEARVALAVVLDAAERAEEAIPVLEEAIDLARQRGDVRWLVAAEELLHRLRARPAGA